MLFFFSFIIDVLKSSSLTHSLSDSKFISLPMRPHFSCGSFQSLINLSSRQFVLLRSMLKSISFYFLLFLLYFLSLPFIYNIYNIYYTSPSLFLSTTLIFALLAAGLRCFSFRVGWITCLVRIET